MKHEWLFWSVMGFLFVLVLLVLLGALWHLRSDEAYERLFHPAKRRAA